MKRFHSEEVEDYSKVRNYATELRENGSSRSSLNFFFSLNVFEAMPFSATILTCSTMHFHVPLMGSCLCHQ